VSTSGSPKDQGTACCNYGATGLPDLERRCFYALCRERTIARGVAVATALASGIYLDRG
jgi:hypothetical protein